MTFSNELFSSAGNHAKTFRLMQSRTSFACFQHQIWQTAFTALGLVDACLIKAIVQVSLNFVCTWKLCYKGNIFKGCRRRNVSSRSYCESMKTSSKRANSWSNSVPPSHNSQVSFGFFSIIFSLYRESQWFPTGMNFRPTNPMHKIKRCTA